ncbi:hypothetical protein BDZ91DRAFT_710996 [Kalaharituber pfeilii]|nr:hypothetical protein BDZ91DRAFT_710996 [Kalaharituber pfeilii]
MQRFFSCLLHFGLPTLHLRFATFHSTRQGPRTVTLRYHICSLHLQDIERNGLANPSAGIWCSPRRRAYSIYRGYILLAYFTSYCTEITRDFLFQGNVP